MEFCLSGSVCLYCALTVGCVGQKAEAVGLLYISVCVIIATYILDADVLTKYVEN
jgi:hypothetical protein